MYFALLHYAGSHRRRRGVAAHRHLRRRVHSGGDPRRVREEVRRPDPRGLRADRDGVDDDVQHQRRGAQGVQRRQADLGRRGARCGTRTSRCCRRARQRRRGHRPRGQRDDAATTTIRDATAAAFTRGWLRTGDLGYFDKDGFLFIVDRKKDLIIRGGYNVYPREVEEVLYAHPQVAEAAVIGVPDARLGEEVKAFIIPVPGVDASSEKRSSSSSRSAGRLQVPAPHRVPLADGARADRQDPQDRAALAGSGLGAQSLECSWLMICLP